MPPLTTYVLLGLGLISLDPRLAHANADAELNRHYVRQHSPAMYDKMIRHLGGEGGAHFKFRVAEQPVFLTRPTLDKVTRATEAVIGELAKPETFKKLHSQLPDGFDPPTTRTSPEIALIDFALVEGAGGDLLPQLIELQGFANHHALHYHQARILRELVAERRMHAYRDYEFSLAEGGEAGYLDRIKRVIIGDNEPGRCAMVDLAPADQHISQEFVMSERLLGVRPTCVTELLRNGDGLFYRHDPDGPPIRRLYNRLIPWDPARKDFPTSFDYWDSSLAVERVVAPAWVYLWAKEALVHLDLPSVPKFVRLSELARLPSNLNDYVLKPFWGFGGERVVVGPTAQDISAVESGTEHLWGLQERVQYAAWLPAVDGGPPLKTELRVVAMRELQETTLQPIAIWARLSRGNMMNADFNRGSATGVSLALWPAK